MITGTVASWMTRWLTEPRIMRPKPPRPWLPMTMASTSRSLASPKSSRAWSFPKRSCVSTSSPEKTSLYATGSIFTAQALSSAVPDRGSTALIVRTFVGTWSGKL